MASTGPDELRVAAVQAAPVLFDAPATAAKAVALIETAAANGAGLVAFGEGYLPGHPIWLHVTPVTSPVQIGLAGELIEAAITIPGPETDALAEVAQRTGTMVVMGVTERIDPRSTSLAASALVVGPDGAVHARRKLVPAVGERVLFSAGGGDSIRVFDSPWGPVSVLLGGENSNPLLTWTLRELGARIHVAAWPPHFNKPGVMAETMTITARAVAYQNTAYVVAVAGATTPETRARLAPEPAQRALLDAMARDAASAVYAPRGSLLAGPLDGGDGILYADLDLGAGGWAGLVNRHYDRPDLFRVTIDRSAPPHSLELTGSSERRLGEATTPGDADQPGPTLDDDAEDR